MMIALYIYLLGCFLVLGLLVRDVLVAGQITVSDSLIAAVMLALSWITLAIVGYETVRIDIDFNYVLWKRKDDE